MLCCFASNDQKGEDVGEWIDMYTPEEMPRAGVASDLEGAWCDASEELVGNRSGTQPPEQETAQVGPLDGPDEALSQASDTSGAHAHAGAAICDVQGEIDVATPGVKGQHMAGVEDDNGDFKQLSHSMLSAMACSPSAAAVFPFESSPHSASKPAGGEDVERGLHLSKKYHALALAAPPALVFEGITYTVGRKLRCGVFQAEGKQILSGVSGCAHGGRMLAIMGGSGAGKTSLLDVLTLKVTGAGCVQGSIMLDGQPLTRPRFLRCASYVAQEPLLWSQLTTRETLNYAAGLHGSGMSAAERAVLVDEVLVSTGLKSCEHTLVGDLFRKGLSEGQKKRLCIAEALVKRPSILMLDEPTSGLDSTSAFEITRLLHGLAKSFNLVILCTIHQPSHRVFQLFDDALVLATGRIAYCGPREDAVKHMLSLGMPPLDVGMSLPEYLLDVTNPDFTEAELVEKALDAWRPRSVAPARTTKGVRETKMRGVVVQTLVLGRRLAWMISRDPMLYAARWIIALFGNLVFAWVYADAGDRTQAQVLPRIWLLSWSMGAPVFMSVVIIAVYSMDFHILQKELRNGMYRPVAYILSQTLIMIPSLLILAACALLPIYLVVDFAWSVIVQMWLALAVVMLFADCLAQLIAVCVPNYLLGMVGYIGVMFIAFLQAGPIISIASIPPALRWIHAVNPWFLCLRAMVTLDLTSSASSGFGEHGELCEAVPAPCFGRDGASVLDSLGTLLSSFGSEHDPGRDIAVAAGVALAIKLAQYAFLAMKAPQ